MAIEDAFIDFDSTLIKNHTLWEILLNAIEYKKDKKKSYEFYENVVLYTLNKLLKINSEKQFRKMISTLEGVPYSIVKKSIKCVKLRNLSKIDECLGKGEKTLRILSRNDSYLINDILESYGLEKELYDNYKIRIVDIIANHFKQKDGVFTGEVELIVNNKMEHLKQDNNLPFFVDFSDWWECLSYKKKFII
ncbi:MAG: haloacid dehalogenase-like hydrolase [Nanoarchaeota archaeon]|nr:haloacid dehalogenase-like hydrolase [Nanoarchaeota archaeon]MBU4493223.1 haloacid dehalogenase-like hydrolase [Nanoarchaeota archaeon]